MLPANGVTKRSEQVGPKMLHHQTACHRFAGQCRDESVTKSVRYCFLTVKQQGTESGSQRLSRL